MGAHPRPQGAATLEARSFAAEPSLCHTLVAAPRRARLPFVREGAHPWPRKKRHRSQCARPPSSSGEARPRPLGSGDAICSPSGRGEQQRVCRRPAARPPSGRGDWQRRVVVGEGNDRNERLLDPHLIFSCCIGKMEMKMIVTKIEIRMN